MGGPYRTATPVSDAALSRLRRRSARVARRFARARRRQRVLARLQVRARALLPFAVIGVFLVALLMRDDHPPAWLDGALLAGAIGAVMGWVLSCRGG